mmetsp:Transcript_2481/g.8182  ORF Transcript_2481/g.8182 Transcript_2481/m.8182 type:complete len:93 (+) Transcript_2481:34-312(+)
MLRANVWLCGYWFHAPPARRKSLAAAARETSRLMDALSDDAPAAASDCGFFRKRKKPALAPASSPLVAIFWNSASAVDVRERSSKMAWRRSL